MPLKSAIYVDTPQKLKSLVETLLTVPLIAIDTEANSLYAYREQVCLVQISTREQDYIVDPLALNDLSPLGAVMCCPDVQKVFHAADYDITCLKRDFGFQFNNIFDTMLAARLCGLRAVGLAAILQEYAGVEMDKSHQLDNWGERPLSDESLHYAQMDTHFLPYLRDELMQRLHTLNRIDEAQELFDEFTLLPSANGKEFDPEGYWQIGRPNHLKHYQMTVLRELYLWRERTAMEKDLPSFKVLSNNMLTEISLRRPRNLNALSAIGGLSKRFIAEYGDEILQAVELGRSRKDLPSPPALNHPAQEVLERYAALHLWRKDKAQSRGVDSDVILSKHILWQLAHQSPDTLDKLGDVVGIGPWRLANYGPELLDVLNEIREF